MNILTSSAGQPQNCLASYHVTCIHFPGETARHFAMSSGVDGLSLQAARVNTFNGQIVRSKAYDVLPDTKIHLFATPWADLFYVVTLSQYSQKYTCSCGGGLCQHIQQLMGLR